MLKHSGSHCDIFDLIYFKQTCIVQRSATFHSVLHDAEAGKQAHTQQLLWSVPSMQWLYTSQNVETLGPGI